MWAWFDLLWVGRGGSLLWVGIGRCELIAVLCSLVAVE